MIMKIMIRNFKPEDVAQISALGKKYNKAVSDSSLQKAVGGMNCLTVFIKRTDEIKDCP